MVSPYLLDNVSLQFVNASGQDFSLWLAFLNPVAITTTWNDLNTDAQGNWIAPPNVDTVAQHLQPYAPTANLGPNRIGFVGEPLYVDGTRSCQRFDLPVVSYAWSVTGMPTQTTYNNGSQLALTWSSPGLYTITLTVTDRYGATTSGTRQVMIYPDRSSALPGVISVQGLSGSLGNGGWQCQVTTVNSQVTLFPPDLLPPGTYQPVVLLCETRYEVQPDLWINATLGPNGTFSPGYPYQDPRILFDGYVQNGTIHQDTDKDTLSFVCLGPQLLLGECKTHQIGYYNATYKTTVGGIPTAMNTSPAGQGFLVSGLMTADVIHSLLQTHSTVGMYHDIHLWNANIPTSVYQPGGTNATYNLIYTTLSVNEGTIAQNISDLANNEWSTFYCEHDGSIRVGPQVNYRGSDYWQQPQQLGQASASAFLNFLQDLGYTLGDTLSGMNGNVPIVPSQPMPVVFVHPWGNQGIPTGVLQPFSQPSVILGSTLQSQNGPPILGIFSDVPIYDSPPTPGTFAPNILFPWTSATPQNLAIQPLSFDITESYTGKSSVVKLIGTLYGHTTLWVSWWPQNAFQIIGTGSGTSTLVASVLPSGNWLIDQSHVLPDISTQQNFTLMSNWWWEMARRVYYATNVNYSGTITLGMTTFSSLGDIVAVTRQNNTLGPHWSAKPFTVTDIAYNLDLSARTWQTTLTVQEVTSILLGPITAPPAGLPRGYV